MHLRLGEFCSCCCLPLLPQLPRTILTTLGPLFSPALYSNKFSAQESPDFEWRSDGFRVGSSVVIMQQFLAGERKISKVCYLIANAGRNCVTDNKAIIPLQFLTCLYLTVIVLQCFKRFYCLKPGAAHYWSLCYSPLSAVIAGTHRRTWGGNARGESSGAMWRLGCNTQWKFWHTINNDGYKFWQAVSTCPNL